MDIAYYMDVKKRLLIVDDDPDILEALQLIFDSSDYVTKTLIKGEDTYQLVSQFNPNLIMLDIFLSGIDGRTICRNLKNSKHTKDIPIIMISANHDAAQSTFAAGANYFFAKPFDTYHLIEQVEKLLN